MPIQPLQDHWFDAIKNATSLSLRCMRFNEIMNAKVS